MIADFAQDLITKITPFCPVGMAAAGGPIDPSMQTAPLPAAWILFEGEQVVRGDNRGYRQEDVNLTFTVAVVISYASQPDLLNNQLPLLESVRSAVSGKDSPTSGLKWKYIGQNLVEVSNDRLVYEQKFMVSSSIQT